MLHAALGRLMHELCSHLIPHRLGTLVKICEGEFLPLTHTTCSRRATCHSKAPNVGYLSSDSIAQENLTQHNPTPQPPL